MDSPFCNSGSDSVCRFKNVMHDLLSVVQGIIKGTAIVHSLQDSSVKVWKVEQLHLTVTIASDRERIEQNFEKYKNAPTEPAKDPELSGRNPDANNQSRNPETMESLSGCTVSMQQDSTVHDSTVTGHQVGCAVFMSQPNTPTCNSPLQKYGYYMNDSSAKHETVGDADDEKDLICPDQIVSVQHDTATDYCGGAYQKSYNNGELESDGETIKAHVKKIAHSANSQSIEPAICIKTESNHNTTSHPFGERLDPNRLQRTVSADNGATCASCNRTFKHAGYLETHRCGTQYLSRKKHLHDGSGKSYPCGVCDKTFSSSQSQKLHENIHLQHRPYACIYCAMTFARSETLHLHLRTHTGEKPFSCLYCSKSFTQKSNLILHMRVHTGEKPYSCPWCNRMFSQKCNLDRHVSRHIETERSQSQKSASQYI